MGLSLVTVLLVTVFVGDVFGSIDRDHLKTIPSPKKHFDTHQWLGAWYIQGRIASCLWKGSSAFTDYRVDNSQGDDKHTVWQKSTWRNKLGTCSDMTALLKPNPQTNRPGDWLAIDPIGDLTSGGSIVVSTDYHKYSIEYGCVKRDVTGGMCDDFWVTLYTRKPEPGRECWVAINQELSRIFHLTLPDMDRVRHKNPCGKDSLYRG